MTQSDVRLDYLCKGMLRNSHKYFIEKIEHLQGALRSKITYYTILNMLLGTPYALDSFQTLPNVFIIH
jgi:hypothetical protein